MTNYSEMSLAELRAILRANNVAGYSSMRKAEMVALLEKMNIAGEDNNEDREHETATKAVDSSAVKTEDQPSSTKVEKTTVAVKKDPAEQRREVSAERRSYGTVTRRTVGRTGNAAARSETAEKRDGGERSENVEKRDAVERSENAEKRDVVERSENAEKRDVGDRSERQENRTPVQQGDPSDSGIVRRGIFEICSDNYGFLRNDNYLPSEHDVYINPSMIRRYNLTTGDVVEGTLKRVTPGSGEKFVPLHHITKINDKSPELAMHRRRFDRLTPVFPHERLRMEYPGCNVATRAVDLFSPIGKGQRGMIVSQPKAGKTTLLKQIARSILMNHKNVHLIILLIDERPEEVTDFKEFVKDSNAEVIYSTFDEEPNRHRRVSEMTMERAKRLVEYGEDVVILLDSITRLARAYNLTCVSSGRTLSGGLDPNALYMPKKFFGAARCMKEGGSLTILATALVETGSRMDDVIYEEFKGTGNMELVLNRDLSERRIFPAIDLPKSSTRREDLLLTEQEQRANNVMRRAFNGKSAEESIEKIINMLVRTKNNQEFMQFILR